MAKITDPTSLSFSVNGTPGSTEVLIDTGLKTIQLAIAGNLDDTAPGKTSGVTAKALYSALKEEWLDGTVDGGATDFSGTLRRFKFPLKMIFEGSFIWVNGWAPADDQTRDLFRDAGFQEGVTSDEYSCLISLGTIDAPGTDLVYYTQLAGFTASTAVYDKTGELNENVLTLDFDGVDSRTYLKSYLREEGKLFSEYNLLTEQGLSIIGFQAYSFPLSNGEDLKRTALGVSDATIIAAAGAPWDLMEINYLKGTTFETATVTTYVAEEVLQDTAGRWFFVTTGGTVDGAGVADYTANGGTAVLAAYFGEEQIGADFYAFNRIVTCNSATDVESYGFMQANLRETGDINDDNAGITAGQGGFGTVNGEVAALLGVYVGDTLKPAGGVLLRGFDTNSTNSIVHSPIDVDTNGLDSESVPLSTTEVPFPFVSAGNFNFSANLDDATDADTFYTVYFSYILRTTDVGSDLKTSSGLTTILDFAGASAGSKTNLNKLNNGDYINITGFTTNTTNNGLYICTEDAGATTVDEIALTKQDGVNPIDDVVGESKVIDTNPFESPGAVIVNDNAGPSPMSGNITAAVIGWDFDYTNNVQGERVGGTDAPIRVVAQALDGAEWIDATHTITAATGQNIAINAGDERNYENP